MEETYHFWNFPFLNPKFACICIRWGFLLSDTVPSIIFHIYLLLNPSSCDLLTYYLLAFIWHMPKQPSNTQPYQYPVPSSLAFGGSVSMTEVVRRLRWGLEDQWLPILHPSANLAELERLLCFRIVQEIFIHDWRSYQLGWVAESWNEWQLCSQWCSIYSILVRP